MRTPLLYSTSLIVFLWERCCQDGSAPAAVFSFAVIIGLIRVTERDGAPRPAFRVFHMGGLVQELRSANQEDDLYIRAGGQEGINQLTCAWADSDCVPVWVLEVLLGCRYPDNLDRIPGLVV